MRIMLWIHARSGGQSIVRYFYRAFLAADKQLSEHELCLAAAHDDIQVGIRQLCPDAGAHSLRWWHIVNQPGSIP
jgi:hypothetical protein